MNFTKQWLTSAGRGMSQVIVWALGLILLPLLSRGQSGTDMYDAIFAGSFTSCGNQSFSSYGNNYYYNGTYYSNNYNEDYNYNHYFSQPSPDVWYSFQVDGQDAEISISLCGSNFDTYVHLVDEYGNELASNDDGDCGYQSTLTYSGLPAGYYYVVVEGYSENTGDFSLSISSSGSGSAPAGANRYSAINAGTFSNSGNYSHSLSNVDACLGDDYGRPGIDIYYQFTLTSQSIVKLSHCGSGFDTYMWLLDGNGNLIASNDDEFSSISPCPGNQSYLQRTLSAGTYYVVSEGYSGTGTIVTNINVTIAPTTVSYPSIPSTFTVGVPVTPIVPSVSNAPGYPWQVTNTYAGSYGGYADGAAATARFDWPLGVAVDASGNIYVADSRNLRIRKITPAGVISTIAGSGYRGANDGAALSASFNNPLGLAIDASGNIYVCDQGNNKIRKISPSGVVSTFAGNGSAGFSDGTGTGAMFSAPGGICIDAAGNLYVGDGGNRRIRKITSSGVVSTYAGTGAIGAANGAASSATFKEPRGVIMDAAGNLIVCDRQNYLVRKITPAGVVSTLAGTGVTGYIDGPASSARFGSPNSVAIDELGNIYIGDQNGNHMVRKIATDGTVSTLAGSTSSGNIDGAGLAVRFYNIYGLCSAPGGILYVADTYNHTIRKINTSAFSINPSLPAGLTLNRTNGTISGTPTAATPATTYTISAYNAAPVSFSFAVTTDGTPVQPSQDQNYIITYSPREDGLFTSESVVAASSNPKLVQTTIQYFDGLGRPLQTVQVKASGDATKDMVIANEYDAYGREAKKYLPYASASNNGSYKTNALTEVINYYNNSMAPGQSQSFPTPFSQAVFEPSPLNRVQEQGAPGNAWQPLSSGFAGAGHTIKTEYGSNVENEVFNWNSAPGVHIVGIGGFYSANQLFKITHKNENWVSGKAGTTEEFKDKKERLILRRTWETETKCQSTYYVYDNLDNLLYVLPPEVTETGNSARQYYYESDPLFLQYIYAYHHDHRNRVVEKKIPGKGWEYFIYNKMDQLVASQDAEQRKSEQWLVYKYDAMGRVVMTGLTTASRTDAQNGVEGQSRQWEIRAAAGLGYSENCWPGSLSDVLSINYYDNYDFPGNSFGPPSGTQSLHVTGLLTGSKVKVLGSSVLLLTVNYYDNKGRLVQTKADNHLSGTDIVDNTYSFTGELTSSTRTHMANSLTTTIANTWGYDHMGRKTQTKQWINNPLQEVLLSKLEYNEVGQLKDKKLHNSQYITSYTYNARGWLKSQDNSLFSMSLLYDDHSIPALKQYNGNISGQTWGPSSNPNLHHYNYKYDQLNRLIEGTSDEGFNEVINYDVMGNITNLSRNPMGTNTYSYTGNQLSSISGFTNGSYGYDLNGNMTSDGPKNITIEYNYLNLPQTISKPGEQMSNTWLATGTKVKKVANGSTRDYVEGIEYNNGTIEFIQTEEGRARPNGGSYFYEYMLKDHLGNTRVMIDQNGSVQETSDYYPFGLQIARSGQTVPSPENRYKYNGKELQTELGLNQYDYGARFYDPVIGRFTTVDPSADEADQESWSPYGYVYSNPVKHIDPDGRIPILIPVIYVAAKVAVHAAAWATIYVGARAVHEKYKNSQQNASASEPEEGAKGSASNPHETTRASRRDAMRRGGVPTSRPLHQDKKTNSKDQVLLDRDGEHTVQDAKNDESHKGQPHWEAGKTKKDPSKEDGLNRSGNGRSNTNKPRMEHPKGKSYYKPEKKQ